MAQKQKYPSVVLKPNGVVSGLLLDFNTPCASGNWPDFFSSLGLKARKHLSAMPSNEDWIVDFVALPIVPKDVAILSLYLTGEVHSHEGEVAHWRLQWRQVPRQEPPESIAKASTSIGGYENFLSGLIEGWPGEKTMPGMIKASYLLFREHWKSGLISETPRAKRFHVDGHDIKVEAASTKFSIEPPYGILTHVTQRNLGKELFEVEASGNGVVTIGKDLVNNEEQIWLGIKPFINEKKASSN